MGYAKCVPLRRGIDGYELFMWSDKSGIQQNLIVDSPQEGRRLWSDFINDDSHYVDDGRFRSLDQMAY